MFGEQKPRATTPTPFDLFFISTYFFAMKRSLLFTLFVLATAFGSYAQRSPVDETDMAVKGIPRKGQRVTLQLDSRRVEDAWVKQLNEQFGNKVKADKGIYTLEGVVIESVSKTPVRVISKVDAAPTGTSVWWSIDLGNAYLSKDGTPAQWTSSENYLKEFARTLYRQDLAVQIQEAEKALANSQNNHNSVIAKQDNIKKDIEKNKLKKADIQQQAGPERRRNAAAQQPGRHEPEGAGSRPRRHRKHAPGPGGREGAPEQD